MKIKVDFIFNRGLEFIKLIVISFVSVHLTQVPRYKKRSYSWYSNLVLNTSITLSYIKNCNTKYWIIISFATFWVIHVATSWCANCINAWGGITCRIIGNLKEDGKPQVRQKHFHQCLKTLNCNDNDILLLFNNSDRR